MPLAVRERGIQKSSESAAPAATSFFVATHRCGNFGGHSALENARLVEGQTAKGESVKTTGMPVSSRRMTGSAYDQELNAKTQRRLRIAKRT